MVADVAGHDCILNNLNPVPSSDETVPRRISLIDLGPNADRIANYDMHVIEVQAYVPNVPWGMASRSPEAEDRNVSLNTATYMNYTSRTT
jgi:hypothetical protein